MTFDWKLLRFPFDDPRWKNKLLIGMVVSLLGPLTLGLLSLPVWGYGFQVMKRTTQDGQPYLPEWDEWGTLFKDGLRYWLVTFIYQLPAALLMVLLVVMIYGLPFVGIFSAEALGTSMEDSSFPLLMFGSYFLMFPVIGLYTLAMALGALFGQIGATRMAAEGSFSAAFSFGEIWRLVRRGAKHFLIAVVLWGLTFYVLQFVVSMLQATLILICFIPFINGLLRVYQRLLAGSLFGSAYYHSQAQAASDPSLEEDAKDGKLRFRWAYLNYPFDDAQWRRKLLTGALLGLFTFLVIPAILLHGYSLRAMRQAIRDDAPSLPVWDDWGDLLRDGVRGWFISLVYSSPGWIPYLCLLVLWAVLIPLIVSSGPDNPAIFVSLTGGGWLSFMILGALSSILFPIMIVASFLSMVATTRYAASNDIQTAFQLREVWSFARRGFRYYLTASLILAVVGGIFGFGFALLFYTVILLCLYPFMSASMTAYLVPVRGNMLGIAYRYTQAYTDPAHLRQPKEDVGGPSPDNESS